jgi:ABC-2 type transport system ATP-binding protein
VAVHELGRRFGAVTAVDRVSFDVPAGALFGLVGPDGAGKTTTLRMLAGVLRPSDGDAAICGVSVARDPEGVKHHIGYMSQRFGLYGDLTVQENIAFYADLYRVPASDRAARRERLYQFSGLAPFVDRLASQLSGGMKQKLGLCCALIHQPEVLLLDEPTFGVDPISRRDLWLIIHEMVGQGVAVVVSTSYLDEAERCDHVALLDHGRIVALDRPKTLQDAVHGVTLEILTSDPRAAALALAGVAGVRRAERFGDSVHAMVTSRDRDWPAIAAALSAAHVEVQGVETIEASLEDVFIDRMSAADQEASA